MVFYRGKEMMGSPSGQALTRKVSYAGSNPAPISKHYESRSIFDGPITEPKPV